MNRQVLNEIKQKKTSNVKLIPVPQWNDYHPWPPIGGLRHLRFNSETNGFKTAFIKVGSRVLVDESEFFACVERQNEGVSG